ncbi:MAG: tetratricopeptide repeat protein [Ignavibacteria bacterium]|nr:tetratricopeptide repeat protein [Ignavibacteria bacterium]
MKRVLFPIVLLFAMIMVFTGFQCASTEITSAKLYINQKNWDKALNVLNKEVEKNPKSDEGYYLLGLVHSEKEDVDNTIKAFNNSLSISKKFEKEILAQKKVQWANYFNKAVSYFNRAMQSVDADTQKIQYDRSIYAFNQAIKLEPDSADTYKNLSFVYLNQQKLDEAIIPLKKLISLEASLEGYRFLGEIYFNQGNALMSKYGESKAASDSVEALELFNQSIEVLEKGRANFPNDSEILLFLSNAYIAANKIDVAIDAFKAGVQQEPMNQYYRYNYGVLLLGGNNFAEAAEQFEKALEIDPTYLNADYNLAVTYVKWGASISKIAEEKGEESTEAKKKYELALPHLESYLAQKTDDPGIWELTGRVYSILGNLEKAQKAFETADTLRKR